jgi:hypothetical protein
MNLRESRMKKKQQWNQRIVRPVLLSSIVLIVICLFLVALYVPGWSKQVKNLQGTSTAVVSGTNTQVAGSTNTAAVIAEQQTQAAIATLRAVTTATATATSAPVGQICGAKVVGDISPFYLFPSTGYKEYQNITFGTPVNILGRWPDKGWYKVSIDDAEGWMRSNSIRLDDPNCDPIVYTISYLLGLDQTGTTPLLNDSFATNENIWADSSGTRISPTTNFATTEQQLVINAEEQSVVSTDTRLILDVPAFHFVTSVELSSFVKNQSFLGIRFRDNDTNYYEIRIFPGTLCEVRILKTNEEINKFRMDPKACISNSYFIDLSLSSDSTLNLRMNGFDVISSFNFGDNEDLIENGTIKLVVNKGKAAFDFIAVTSAS